MEGKTDLIWSTVRQNPSNEALANYVAEFKNLQVLCNLIDAFALLMMNCSLNKCLKAPTSH